MKGLEPSTFCMASRRSSQLSYIRGRASIDRPPRSREGRGRDVVCGRRRRPGVVPGARPETTPCVQLPVVLGGAVLDELEPGMFGQWRPLAAPGAAEPAEPVEPVLEPVDVEL